jgi:hypothetical protein
LRQAELRSLTPKSEQDRFRLTFKFYDLELSDML